MTMATASEVPQYNNAITHKGDSMRLQQAPALKPRTPLQTIYLLALLAAISMFLGAGLPGIVAYESNVLDMVSLRQRVKSVSPDAEKRLQQYETSQAKNSAALSSLDTQIGGAPISSSSLSVIRQSLVQELAKPAPISIQPYSFHLIDYFWPIMYFGLSTALIVIRPSGDYFLKQDLRLSVVYLALGIFVFSAGPLMLRTLFETGATSGRTVYAWTNPDLSKACFAMQLTNFAVFSLCLAFIWRQWSSFATSNRGVIDDRYHPATVSTSLLTNLTRLLYRWQVIFVSVSSGFVLYTAIFWNQIVRHHDSRFYFEAIVAHVLWITTIVITMNPLVSTWHEWHQQKLTAIAALINETETPIENLEARVSAIKDLDPIPGWNLTASAVAVITSLAGPLVQTLIK